MTSDMEYLKRDLEYLHYHTLLEIGYCYGGAGICRNEEVEQAYAAGDAQVINRYQRHIDTSSGKTPARWNWIYVDIANVLAEAGLATGDSALQTLCDSIPCGIISRATDPEVCALVKRFIDASSACKPHRMLMCAALLIELLVALSDMEENGARGAMNVSLSPALVRIATEIGAGRMPTVPELAKRCGMSISTFRRTFARELGLSPSEYVHRFAIDKAQGLLLYTDMSVTRICEESGFEDLSGFGRCFKQYTNGLSPSDYRRKNERTGQKSTCKATGT